MENNVVVSIMLKWRFLVASPTDEFNKKFGIIQQVLKQRQEIDYNFFIKLTILTSVISNVIVIYFSKATLFNFK